MGYSDFDAQLSLPFPVGFINQWVSSVWMAATGFFAVVTAAALSGICTRFPRYVPFGVAKLMK